ncbi:MAG: hypothetical protein IJ644_02725 [Oscillospiraceae bacterium]|nr:hypothetical protein [Oscillospiraceae bacterium]
MWSNIRNKLENVYLADSLKGRIQYFTTTYRECHDREGRASIRLDDEEILKSSYFDKIGAHSKIYYSHSADWESAYFLAESQGCFDQRNFYQAFQEFDNQSIQKSLQSERLLVRIFAILDRRTGKRTLLALENHMKNENQILQLFYHIRLDAEHINSDVPRGTSQECET